MTFEQFNSEDRKIEYEVSLNGLEFQDGILKIASITQKFAAEMRTASYTAFQAADAVNATGAAAEQSGEKLEGAKEKIDESEEALHSFIKSAASISFDFLKDSLGDFWDSQEAVTKLEDSLRKTGYAAGFSAQELEAQANFLQQTTTFSDEATMGVQSALAAFSNISGDNFSAAVPAVLDLATAMNEDLDTAAASIGKALQDPAGGLKQLEDSGVSFSEAQKAMIQSMMSNNDVVGAQGVILDQLRDQYGNAATAAASAGAGPFQVFQNQVTELKEGVGGLVEFGLSRIKPVLDLAMEPLKFFSGALYDANLWVRENEDAATLLVAAVAALGLAIGGKTLVMEGATIATNVLAAAEAGLNAIMNANPIGLIITGLLAFGAVVTYAYQNVGWFRGGILGVFYAFQALTDFVSTVVTGTLQGLGDMVKGIFTFDTDLISSGFNKATDSFREGARKIGEAFDRGMKEGQADVDAREKAKKEQSPEEIAKRRQTQIPRLETPFAGMGGANAGSAPVSGTMSTGMNPAAAAAGTGAGRALPAMGGSSVDKVSGNGPVNINITINDGLVKTINFTTNNYQEGMTAMKDEVAAALTSAIHDSQIIAA